MIQTNTKTITSKDISESQKSLESAHVLGYKIHTVTMHAGSQDGSLTKEVFEAILKKVVRPAQDQPVKGK